MTDEFNSTAHVAGRAHQARLVLRACLGMSEKMGTSKTVKVALAKTAGALVGVVLFTLTLQWAVLTQGTQQTNDAVELVQVLTGAMWFIQCIWMGSAACSMLWISAMGPRDGVSTRDGLLLALFGVTPGKWSEKGLPHGDKR